MPTVSRSSSARPLAWRFVLAVCDTELCHHAFGQLGFDVDDGVEGRHGLLEDHGDASAAVFAHVGRRELYEVGAAEANLAIDDASGWRWDEAEDAEGTDRFSASALPYQCDGFAFFDVVADAVDGLDYGVIATEVGFEVFDFEKGQFELSALGSPSSFRWDVYAPSERRRQGHGVVVFGICCPFEEQSLHLGNDRQVGWITGDVL